jgi:hypothetical protein
MHAGMAIKNEADKHKELPREDSSVQATQHADIFAKQDNAPGPFGSTFGSKEAAPFGSTFGNM